MNRILDAIGKQPPIDPRQARRLFHGRGHCFPGLEFINIDLFPPVVQIILYKKPEALWLEQLCIGLRESLGAQANCLVIQRRHLPGAPNDIVFGELPEVHQAWESGLRYQLRVGRAQNGGLFLDMAAGRDLVRRVSAGRSVLNLFAYTCAFSVAAMTSGATSVVNLDMNQGALNLGRTNHRLNGLDTARVRFLPHDLFKTFGKLRSLGPYDLVIIDPPGNQGESFRPERDWPKILRRLPELLAPGGEILACVSAPQVGARYLLELFAAELPQARLIEHAKSGPDFPEIDPDKGLNLLHFRG